MLLPVRAKNPPESLPIMTCALMLLNVLIYAFTSNGFAAKRAVVEAWGLKSSNFNLAHMMSSMFLHGNIFHILGNMWFLYLFGFAVEGRLRTLKFALVYFLAGLAGDLLHHILLGAAHPNMPSIGASGAIMGVVGAALWMFPHAKITFFYWFGLFFRGTFDVPMWGVGLFYVGIDAVSAFGGAQDGVGHFAHLGGALAGFLLCMLFRPTRDSALASDAKATLSETKDLKLLTRSELEELHRVTPEDTTVVLNWVVRSSREPGGVRQNCQDAFIRLLPKIILEQDVRTVSSSVGLMPTGLVKPNYLMQIASGLERVGDPVTANRFYELVQHHPDASNADLEASAFRTAILAELSFKDYHRAWSWYEYVLNTWPMGPFAEQAKARMVAISKMPPKPTNP